MGKITKVVAIIPARRNSQRLPKKNKRILCGKSVIKYTIDEAIKCTFLDEIVISTNDPDIFDYYLDYDDENRNQ